MNRHRYNINVYIHGNEIDMEKHIEIDKDSSLKKTSLYRESQDRGPWSSLRPLLRLSFAAWRFRAAAQRAARALPLRLRASRQLRRDWRLLRKNLAPKMPEILGFHGIFGEMFMGILRDFDGNFLAKLTFCIRISWHFHGNFVGFHHYS